MTFTRRDPGRSGGGVSYAPYERAIRLLLIAVGGVLAVTMLVVSVSHLAAGREITGRLQAIGRLCRACGRATAALASLVGTAGTSWRSWLATSMGCWTRLPARCQPEGGSKNHRR
jgi:hypothetical protein